jgi:hypothetical protein
MVQTSTREPTMATDLMVMMEDRPGALAELGMALGDAGVNLGGGCAMTSRGQGMIHLLIEDDPAAARDALAAAGIDVTAEREVLVVEVEDAPGALGAFGARFAEAGANVELVYLATSTRLVFGVDDLEAGRRALS